MTKIQCKPVLLNKLLFTLFSGVALIVVVCAIAIPNSIKTFILPLSLSLASVSIVVMFYLSKNEVYTMILDGEVIHLDFFNKSFFKRKNLELNRNELVFNMGGGLAHILHNNKLIAIVRKNSLKEEEWLSVQNFFKK